MNRSQAILPNFALLAFLLASSSRVLGVVNRLLVDCISREGKICSIWESSPLQCCGFWWN